PFSLNNFSGPKSYPFTNIDPLNVRESRSTSSIDRNEDLVFPDETLEDSLEAKITEEPTPYRIKSALLIQLDRAQLQRYQPNMKEIYNRLRAIGTEIMKEMSNQPIYYITHGGYAGAWIIFYPNPNLIE